MGILSDIFRVDKVKDVLAAISSDDDYTGYNVLLSSVLFASFRNVETISATKELTDNDYQIQLITPNGANRTVELPVEAVTNHSHLVACAAGASYDVIVKDDSGATTYETLSAGESALCISDGATWAVEKFGAAGAEVILGDYKLETSISSDDLVLAMKDLDGNVFSSSNTLKIKVGDTEVSLNSAMSLTVADATNWANLGSSEHAAQDVDLFAYVVLETGASAGNKLGWSRIPYGSTVGDFSSTTTDEKYLAGPTNYNATDKVVNIGRFNATLSAGAGYTWTIPATSIIVNYPIFETRWLSWSPSWTNISVGDGTEYSVYKISGNKVFPTIGLNFGSTTSVSGAVSLSLPFSNNGSFLDTISVAVFREQGTGQNQGAWIIVDSTTSYFYALNVASTYALQTQINATIPFTWGQNDQINCSGGWYKIN